LPMRLRARDRRPGAPSPTPGTTNALVRKAADGGALVLELGGAGFPPEAG